MLLDFPRVRLFFFNVKNLSRTFHDAFAWPSIAFDIKGVQTRQRKVLKLPPRFIHFYLNDAGRLSLAFSTGHTLFSVVCFLLA